MASDGSINEPTVMIISVLSIRRCWCRANWWCFPTLYVRRQI